MQIGINGSNLIAVGAPVAKMVDHAIDAEQAGFSSYWMAQLTTPDALTAIAHIGTRTERIELGTAVIPTWTRHPLMLAAQALTVQDMIGNRLLLGIGLAHKVTVESALRIPFAKPAQHMEEYLNVLLPALHDRKVSARGEFWSAEVEAVTGVPGGEPPAVLLAAMGPRMLEMAGGRCAGSILWLSGPRVIAERIRPALESAAEAAGAGAPRIVASVPVCVTENADQVRGFITAALGGYNDLPSYKGVMEASGASGPADVSVVGTADEVREHLAAFAAAGATDFAAVELGTNPDETAATRELLVELAAS